MTAADPHEGLASPLLGAQIGHLAGEPLPDLGGLYRDGSGGGLTPLAGLPISWQYGEQGVPRGAVVRGEGEQPCGAGSGCAPCLLASRTLCLLLPVYPAASKYLLLPHYRAYTATIAALPTSMVSFPGNFTIPAAGFVPLHGLHGDGEQQQVGRQPGGHAACKVKYAVVLVQCCPQTFFESIHKPTLLCQSRRGPNKFFWPRCRTC